MRHLLLCATLAVLPTGAAAQTPDARLNALYGSMTARIGDDAAGRDRLVAAQRAWITFRDAECRFRTGGIDGSAAPMALRACLEDLTLRRVADFEGLLDCPEGDLACPLPRAD